MLKIAFASNDTQKVNLHFGGAENLVIYDVAPGRADLIGRMAFASAETIGEAGRTGLRGTVHDKVLAKLDFIDGCSAIYAVSIGSSSIRRLMALGIQPIIVDNGHEILDLLNEVSLALVYGGLAWVEKAKEKAANQNPASAPASLGMIHQLLQSIEQLESR